MAIFSRRVKQDALVQAREMGVDLQRLPRHVAIIMDGNGRWGVRHRGVRSMGHRAGVEALRAIGRFMRLNGESICATRPCLLYTSRCV